MGFHIGENCRIHPSAVINVEEGFLGAGSIINENVRIEGSRIEIGREAFIDRNATIGGGSCFDPEAILRARDWLHMGYGSQINTACGVEIGHEFGCGIETKIFTHGAYIDSYALGAPVQWAGVTIGDSVWMPNAWVNPGVRIGSSIVVAARSLVNRDLPSGSLAGGVPCKVLKENYLPRILTGEERKSLIDDILVKTRERVEKTGTQPTYITEVDIEQSRIFVSDGGRETIFNLQTRLIEGLYSIETFLIKDQLRRNGIRFRSAANGKAWQRWGKDPLTYF